MNIYKEPRRMTLEDIDMEKMEEILRNFEKLYDAVLMQMMNRYGRDHPNEMTSAILTAPCHSVSKALFTVEAMELFWG